MSEDKCIKPHGSSPVWKFLSEDQPNVNNSEALYFKLQLINSDSNNLSSTDEDLNVSLEENEIPRKKKRYCVKFKFL